MENSLVVKSNELIEARYELNLNEQKIILYSVSKLNRNEKNLNIITIGVKDFFKLINTSTERYTEIRNIVRNLRNREIIIDTSEGEIITGWLSSIEYKRDSGTIDLEFSKKLIPYLLQLKKRFTRYPLRNILHLKSKYGIRVYELMKQYQSIGKREFKLEELKRILFIENQYERIYDLERFVLKPAKKEINKHTDIRIHYQKIKTGRKITDILFFIEDKDLDRKIYNDYLNEFYSIKEIKSKMGLDKENFNTEQIMSIYSKAIEKAENEEIDLFEYVRLNYSYMGEKPRNPYSYLMKCLENDYAKAIGQIKFNFYTDR